jgi:2-polyprenyl-3-methyl-5-hydroxy-6-metoxy-1,4-benzoquinol methylase
MINKKHDAVKKYFDKRLWLNSEIEINNRMEIVKELLDDVTNKKILDIGCGDGRISLQFKKNNSLLLLDVSEKMLEITKDNAGRDSGNIRLLQADILEYTTGEKFDIIICIGVLAHVRSVEEVITKISSLLIDRGICVLQFTNSANIVGWFNRFYFNLKAKLKHTRNYSLNKISLKNIQNISDGLGWHNKSKFCYFSYSPLVNILSKMLNIKGTTFIGSKKFKKLCSPETIMIYEKIN